jgi:ferrous iron transport protein B
VRKKRIILVGNPNVGKSVIFHRLTGTRVITANYPGTTVAYTQGNLTYPSAAGTSPPLLFQPGERIEVIDAPGTYTLESTCRAEEVTVEILRSADLVVNVVDATNIERNLYLTFQLLEGGCPLVVVLNLWDETAHLGIEIDAARLEAELGVPVVSTVAVTGEGIRQLVERLQEARPGKFRSGSSEDRWREIGRIVSACQILHHHHHTFLQRLSDFSVQPLTGIPLAALVIIASFKFIRLLGESIIDYAADPLFQKLYAPLLYRLSDFLRPWAFLHDFVVGRLIGGRIDFVQSFGILSTGLYIELAMVLPYVISFYLILSFMEDFGYLPRLAVLLDNLMHRMGLHGYAIIPNLLGLGCNVPGILATRILESRRERFIAATLISIAVPCAALQAMIFGLVGKRGGQYVAAIYLTLFLIWLLLGLILNRFAAGYSPELIIEIPLYRMPPLGAFFKKVGMRI